MNTLKKKKFDSVDFMRRQRDKINKEIVDMDFEQIKEFLARHRKKSFRRKENS